jgi:phosphoglucan,water dikinase
VSPEELISKLLELDATHKTWK